MIQTFRIFDGREMEMAVTFVATFLKPAKSGTDVLDCFDVHEMKMATEF